MVQLFAVSCVPVSLISLYPVGDASFGFGREQTRLWELFARHTTMTLIILYLVYSQVSTVVSVRKTPFSVPAYFIIVSLFFRDNFPSWV